MVKFLLGIAIVAFTSFCGYLLAKKYRQKKHFFSQLALFNERFLSELAYFRRPIREFIFAYSYSGEFFQFLNDSFYKNTQISFHDILNSSTYAFLKGEEKVFVVNYFSMLGKADSIAQKAYFSSMKDMLKKAEIDAINENKKYGDLYIKMGFLLGLLILILII